MTRLITSAVHDEVRVLTVLRPRLLDPETVDAFDVEVRGARAESPRAPLVIDLGQVRFVSSSLLGVLVMLWREAQIDGVTVALSGVSHGLQQLLRITDIDRIIKTFPDAAQAIAALRPPAQGGAHG